MFRRSTPQCAHLDQINDVNPSAQGCEECLQMGDTWVHLRECLICGHVGGCDSSLSLPVRNGILLFRTTLGFELRATGSSRSAARAAGIGPGRSTMLAMALSGGLIGLGRTLIFR